MKLMIASDLHGDAACTVALLERFKASGAERLVLLGDLLYHGPRNDLPAGYAPKKVIALLNEVRDSLICVRGNCDTEVDQMVLNFPILSETACLYVDGRVIFAAHGHHAPPPMREGDILLGGHTHVPACDVRPEYTYVNPGSVSIPKENSEQSYIIATDERLEWKNLDGKSYRVFEL